MYNENDYIEKLYSEKFAKFDSEISEADWNKLNAKLRKTNFLKFSFATFNILYLLVFVSFAGTATYFGIVNIRLTKKVEFLEQNMVKYQQREKDVVIPIKSDSMVIERSTRLPEIKNGNESAVGGKFSNIKDSKSKVSVVAPSINLHVDSGRMKIDTTLLMVPDYQKIRRVKKTTFVKKDCILIRDTVVVKKSEI